MSSRPTPPCVLTPGHAGNPALALLPCLLRSIHAASKATNRLWAMKSEEEQLFLSELRTNALAIKLHLESICKARTGWQEPAYMLQFLDDILDVAEEAIAIPEHLSDAFECQQWKITFPGPKLYPKCHIFCHLASPDHVARPSVTIPDMDASQALLRVLIKSLDQLQDLELEVNELQQPTDIQKKKRPPQWDIAPSTAKLHKAVAKCRRQGVACNFSNFLEGRLATSTSYSSSATTNNTYDEGYDVFDVLFALDAERSSWEEVRFHSERSKKIHEQNQSQARHPTASSYLRGSWIFPRQEPEWRRRRLTVLSHFCDIFRYPLRDFRSNITLNSSNVVINHQRTDRTLHESQLEQSISLKAMLSFNESEIDYMTQLTLAVMLGYSLFHFYGGPWLDGEEEAEFPGSKTTWDPNNVIFFGSNGTMQLRPFLRSDFGSSVKSTSESDGYGQNSEEDDDNYHPFPALVSFAITLLEIHLGKSLKRVYCDEVELSTAHGRWAAASKAFRDRKRYIPSANYREVIQTCLNANFDSLDVDADSGYGDGDGDGTKERTVGEHGSSEWDNAHEANLRKIRHTIHCLVVCPLHDELLHNFGKDIDSGDIDKQVSQMTLPLPKMPVNRTSVPMTRASTMPTSQSRATGSPGSAFSSRVDLMSRGLQLPSSQSPRTGPHVDGQLASQFAWASGMVNSLGVEINLGTALSVTDDGGGDNMDDDVFSVSQMGDLP